MNLLAYGLNSDTGRPCAGRCIWFRRTARHSPQKREPRPEVMEGRGLGNPQGVAWVRAPLWQHNGAPEVPSRHVRHEQRAEN
jgi:hypothetical protein